MFKNLAILPENRFFACICSYSG